MCGSHWVTVSNINCEPSTVDVYDSAYTYITSYPGHVFGEKSGLVSTLCARANDSGTFPRTSPNSDKLHLVVMQRNNQTRYVLAKVPTLIRHPTFRHHVCQGQPIILPSPKMRDRHHPRHRWGSPHSIEHKQLFLTPLFSPCTVTCSYVSTMLWASLICRII